MIGFLVDYMGVSKNNGSPKSTILIGVSIINHPFWGTPIFGNTQMVYTINCKCSAAIVACSRLAVTWDSHFVNWKAVKIPMGRTLVTWKTFQALVPLLHPLKQLPCYQDCAETCQCPDDNIECYHGVQPVFTQKLKGKHPTPALHGSVFQHSSPFFHLGQVLPILQMCPNWPLLWQH